MPVVTTSIFTSDSAGTTKIPWEIETCNSSTGDVVMWATPASLSSTVTTSFYVSYGSASYTAAQNTGSVAPSKVWDSSYFSVTHMANGTTLALSDSTGQDAWTNNGLTAAAGTVDGAMSNTGNGVRTISL